MYEAFELQKVVEKLPLKICALATWGKIRRVCTKWEGAVPILFLAGDWFMISTVSSKNEAHLLVYQLKLSTTPHEYEAKLHKTLKKFTSKPITQVPSCWCVVHEVTSFQ